MYQTAGPHHFLQNQQFYPRHLHEANLRLRKIGNFHKKNNNKRKKEKRLCKFLTNSYCQHSTKERYSLFPYSTNKDFQVYGNKQKSNIKRKKRIKVLNSQLTEGRQLAFCRAEPRTSLAALWSRSIARSSDWTSNQCITSSTSY